MDAAYREKKRLATQAWRLANPERARDSVAKCWADPEKKAKYAAQKKEYSRIHAEVARKRTKDWIATHKDDPAYIANKSAYGASWRARFPDKHCAKEMKRRASKMCRKPMWFDGEMEWMIKEAHSLAKLREAATGIKWHVDHIFPLQGGCVSGLHVIENIQVVPSKFNLCKHNSLDVDAGPTRFIG